jgi:L-iditol 2-dehydrogenase
MIGLLAVQALRLAGCSRVIAVDLEPGRLELARRLGATETLCAGDTAAGAIRESTGGRGADAAVECVGAEAPVRTAIAATRKGGAVTLVGNIAPQIVLPLQEVVTRQLRLQGSCASCGEYPAVIELMARGAIQVGPLISAVAPLAEGAAWFDRLYRRQGDLMKVILKP